MTVTSKQIVDDSVLKLEFIRLVERSAEGTPIERLVKDFGLVYVSSITRDGCSGCEEQKPLFEKLAGKVSTEHPGKVQFSNVHIRYSERDPAESAKGKRALGHAAYPTYMIHVKSRYGALELYRAIYPTMEELERQVAASFELAEYYEKDAEKSGTRIPSNA